MNEQPCPWNNRREMSATNWSVFVTHFGVIAANAHLQHSLLNNPNIGGIAFQSFLLYMFPFYGVIDFGSVFVGLLAVTIVSNDRRCWNTSWLNTPCPQFLVDLVGTYTRELDTRKAGPDLQLWRLRHRRFTITPKDSSIVSRLGQCAFLVVLLMQCIGTIRSWASRLDGGIDAVSFVDAQLAWISLSGIFITCRSAVALWSDADYGLNRDFDNHIDSIKQVRGLTHEGLNSLCMFLLAASSIVLYEVVDPCLYTGLKYPE